MSSCYTTVHGRGPYITDKLHRRKIRPSSGCEERGVHLHTLIAEAAPKLAQSQDFMDSGQSQGVSLPAFAALQGDCPAKHLQRKGGAVP